MSHPAKEIFARMGPKGMTRALGDVLDKAKLTRLANTCGLKYPGMRTRSQKTELIINDLVEKASQQITTLKALNRALQKETRALASQLANLKPEDRAARMVDEKHLLSSGRLGRYIFILAVSENKEDDGALEGLLARLDPRPSGGRKQTSSPAVAKPSRGETRLKKQLTVLQKKAKHLEVQLLKSREAERIAKRDLIQRKGELAEARMLSERLGRELTATQTTLREAYTDGHPSGMAEKGFERLNGVIRKLSTEQKKHDRHIEKVLSALPAQGEAVNLAPVQKLLKEVKKEIAVLNASHAGDQTDQASSVAALRAEIKSFRKLLVKPARRTPTKGEAARVGVFIDVQNVFYGARRLKGRLDFDAMMQAAVRDQRLIQATAYVVESKEIDQSGFIALLQHRAIEVRRKTLKVRADGSMKGDWDMELALDILDAAPQLDVVVLVSGDGDFTSLVKKLKRIGPRVEVIGFPRNTAKSLLEAADLFTPLDRKFMIYSRPKTAHKKAGPGAHRNTPTKFGNPGNS